MSTTKLAVSLLAKIGQSRRQSFFRNVVYSSTFPVPLDDQSLVLPGNEHARTSKVLRDPQVLWDCAEDGETTAYEVFLRGIRLAKKAPCLGTRNKTTGRYEWITYEEVKERVKNVGSAFQQFGILPGTEGLLGINTGSVPEFTLTWLASSCYRSVFVPIFNNLSKEGVNHIVSQTEMPLLVCDTEEKIRFLVNQKSLFPKLKTFVLTDRPSTDLRNEVRAVDAEVLSFADFESMGRSTQKEFVPSKPDDLFTICWTSGTTGLPKGVLVTNRNIISGISAISEAFKPAVNDEWVTISYMPTAHIFEIGSQVQLIYNGGRIGFFGGDVLKLMDDIQELKPTFLPMVPRLLNRVYLKLMDDIKANPIKRLFLKRALRRKQELLKQGIITKNTFWDNFIFKRVREEFGGQVNTLCNSAAPLSREVANFFRYGLGCYLLDLYGQTEVGPATMTLPNEVQGGGVGPPVPSCRVKLADVPEMGYFAKDGIGEICVRGPSVTQGYFKNPEATRETIDKDGWLHTGDVGKWLANGSLSVVDRKKNIFKLSQGEFVAPEKIENVYAQSATVAQIFVTGLSSQDYMVAIIVPDPIKFKERCKSKKIGEGSLEELCSKKEARKEVLRHLRNVGKKHGLKSLEQVKNVYLHPTVITPDSRLMTPTLKIKRKDAKEFFQAQIEEMYNEGPLLQENK